MKVLVVRPMELPAVQEIDHTLSAMQELVGGTIQAVYPFDDPVALVCNDEGKLLGLPWNRALTDDHGVPYDIVCGTFAQKSINWTIFLPEVKCFNAFSFFL